MDEWVRTAERRLASAGVESSRLEAQMLAAHVLGVERSWLLAHPEAEVNDLAGEVLLQRRESHEPLAYILGWREFYGRRFRVTPAALIPRQETEMLVDAVCELAPVPGSRVLDLGTGSGCIAISVKLERPDLILTASDVSPGALEVAEWNATELEASVELVLSDGFQALQGRVFDVIVSNPPYVALDEALPRDVVEWEPRQALFAGHTGLEFYKR
ncbi:MAG TPA: peptide chain release factor N(5)-glutamine methyltransferase, partial [Fimbriimonadaceae bacterium]|nr:peptide chain release factor N(5)-glutamine methyltransferase [Fimbriimonadaceae bacterium]